MPLEIPSQHQVSSSHAHRRGVPRGVRRELFIVLLVMALVGWGGQQYFTRYFSPANAPFNAYIGPAITFAFGEGLKNPEIVAGSKLEGFIARAEPRALSRADLPQPIPAGDLTSYQKSYSYLLLIIGYCWKLFGVRWDALGVLIGSLTALSCGLTYALARLVARPVTSLVCSLAYILTPAHVALMMAPRDYAKTPLFLAIFLICGLLLFRSFRWWGLLCVGATLGLVIGIGYGIRPDIYIAWLIVPPILLFALPPCGSPRFGVRVLSVLIAVLVFLVSAAPILQARRMEGDSTSHHLIGGLFNYNERMMGVGDASYKWHNEALLTDNFINTLIQDTHRKRVGRYENVEYLGVPYNKVGFDYAFGIMRSFPADILIRYVASARTILADGPWLIAGPVQTIYDVNNPVVRIMQESEAGLRRVWNACGVWVVLASLFVASAVNLRVGVALSVLTLFFTGYPSIQFHARHFGHLGFIPVMVVCVALERAITHIIRPILVRHPRSVSDAWAQQLPTYRRNIIVYSVLLSAACGGIELVRLYQERELNTLVEHFKGAGLLQAKNTTIERTGEQSRLIRFSLSAPAGDADTTAKYDRRYLAIRFEGDGALPDLVRTFTDTADISIVELAGGIKRGPALVAFPIVKQGHPNTIELIGGDMNMPVQVFTVVSQEKFPVLMTIFVPENGERVRAYKRLIPLKHG